MLDEELIEHLKASQQKLQDEVFSAPPRDWHEFNQRLGRWLQLADSLSFIDQRAEELDK
jgi:hypothetical protein